MPLAEYLAKNYLSADSSSKKRKRKSKSEGLTIADDQEDEWRNGNEQAEVEAEDDAPTVVGTVLSGGLNKPKKNTKWVSVGTNVTKDADQMAADAILAQAQAESRARALEDEDAPAIVDNDVNTRPVMANGALAGLQTAEQVAKALKRKQDAERKAMREAGLDSTGLAQETIYRDASGRIINVAMQRAEARAKADEESRKAAEAVENAKGDVQRREKEERRAALQEAKTMTVARHADDKKLNDELKERERWNDPMAQLIASKKAADGKRSSSRSRATYQGAFEPNRYGIKPGWRWDGVDRSNGFERKWFEARNKAKDRKELEYAWQMDE